MEAEILASSVMDVLRVLSEMGSIIAADNANTDLLVGRKGVSALARTLRTVQTAKLNSPARSIRSYSRRNYC